MLIIYAHPDKEGHCWYILENLEKRLIEDKINYELIDLYEINYNPVLSKKELYTHRWKEIWDDTKKFQDLLEKNDKIIIIYPTWWNSAPAILKGFFDKTLTAWFAFKYIWRFPKWLLKWKVAVITTTWGPSIFQILIAKSRSLKVVVNNTLGFCWFKAKWFLVWNATRINDKQKIYIEKKVNDMLQYLN